MDEVEKTAQDASTEQQGEVKTDVQNASQDKDGEALKIAQDAIAKLTQVEAERDNYKQAALNAKKTLKDGGQLVEIDEDRINDIAAKKAEEIIEQRLSSINSQHESESQKLKKRLEEATLALNNKPPIAPASSGSNQDKYDGVKTSALSEKMKQEIMATNSFAKKWDKAQWQTYENNLRQQGLLR